MGLDKAIIHGKEHRKQYHGSKLYDRTCRNHGYCSYCLFNRLHKFLRAMPVVDDGKIILGGRYR